MVNKFDRLGAEGDHLSAKLSSLADACRSEKLF